MTSGQLNTSSAFYFSFTITSYLCIILPKVFTHTPRSVQVFQSLLWSQVYKIKHLYMKTSSTHICERVGGSQELSRRYCDRGATCASPIVKFHRCKIFYSQLCYYKNMEMIRHGTDLQTSCDFQISSKTLCRELRGMGFHGQENGTCLTALCQV